MSTIDAQIKDLLKKKKKIDYVKYIEDLIKNDTKCVDFKEVKAELTSQIIPVLYKIVQSIENDSEFKINESKSEFTPEQYASLIELSNRYIATKANPQTPNQALQPTAKAPYSQESSGTPVSNKPELSNNDKMNFAMNNRHLANQRVQIINDDRVDIYGLVVGLDAPFIIVKTETGPTIQVPLEKVVRV